MKRLFLFSLVAGFMRINAFAQDPKQNTPAPREFQMKDGDTTYTMRRYILVLLYRGKKADKIPKDQLDKIQEGHMANINRLANEGKLLVAGPIGDDSNLKGIFILEAESVEDAKTMVGTDPALLSGRLRAEYHPWWTARGTVIK